MYNENKDPGVGSSYKKGSKRIINKDGSFNVIRAGGISGIRDVYQSLIKASWIRFLLVVFLFYFVVNALFATIYVALGVENLAGTKPTDSLNQFFQAFYFSCQTFTTVGYGAIAPKGGAANVIAAIEALIGLLSFALVTGLVYGRFSRPDAKIGFSEKLIVAPYRDHKALMFRIVNLRPNTLMEMQANVMITMKESPDSVKRQYFRLELEIDSIQFFPMPWTIVHPIDQDSPLYNISLEELIAREAEVLIKIKGFDDNFGQDVYTRYSYVASEIEMNRKFVPMFEQTDAGDIYIDINQLGATEAA